MTGVLSSVGRLPRFAWALLLFLPLTAWMLASLKPLIHDDVGYILFAVMNGRNFYEPHQRYSDVFTQILPLTLVGWHTPIRVVAYSFLLNLGLYYAMVACICATVSRSNFALSVLGLLVYAGLAEILYWPISDFALGYGALAPVVAWLLDPEGISQGRRWWQAASCLVCLVVALFFHPAVGLGVAGLIVLSIFEARRFDWRHGITLAILLAYAICKWRTADGYETNHLSIGGWSEGRPTKPEMILTVLLPLYSMLLLFALYALSRAIAAKGAARWMLVVSYAGALGYFLVFYLPTHVYIQGGLYRSNLLIPSTFFLIVGGCYVLFQAKSGMTRWVPILLTGVISFLVGTLVFLPTYDSEHEAIEKLVDTARTHQTPLAYLNTGPTFVDSDYHWGISVDTLLWSLMDGKGEPVTIVQESTLQQLFGPNYLKEHEHFAAGYCIRPVPFATMNHDYFSLTPGPYQPIPKLSP